VELLFVHARPTPDLVDVLDELETLIEDVGSGWISPALTLPEGLYVFVDLPDAVEEDLREPIVSALSIALNTDAQEGAELARLAPHVATEHLVPAEGPERERVERGYPGLRVLSDDTGFEEPADIADELADIWDRNPDRQLGFLRDLLALEGAAMYDEVITEAFADRPGVLGFCHQYARSLLGS
jgi:hypothetical protein